MNPNRNVIVLSLSTFLIVFALFSWLYLLPVHLKDLGASDTQVGVTYAIFGLGFTVMQALGGALCDRLGRKRLIVYPTYLMLPCYFFVAIADHWLAASAFYLAANVLSALQMPSFMAMIHESAEKKGGAFGLFEFFIMLGIASGTLAGSFLVVRLGIRWLILGTAMISLVVALVRHGLLRETMDRGTSSSERRTFLASLKLFGEGHRLWLLVSAIFLFLALSITVYGPFLTLFQKEVLNFTEDRINLFFAIGSSLSALASLLGGVLSDRFGARIVLGLSLLFHTLLLYLWTLTGGFMALFVISFSFSQFCHVSYYTLLTGSGEEPTRGRVVGVFGTITGAVSALGPIAAMQLKQAFGFPASFALATSFAVLGGLSLMRAGRIRSLPL